MLLLHLGDDESGTKLASGTRFESWHAGLIAILTTDVFDTCVRQLRLTLFDEHA